MRHASLRRPCSRERLQNDVVLGSGPAQTSELDAALARVAELGTTLSTTEATLGTTKAALAKVTQERNALRRVYQLLLEQHELLRRRIYMASAERIDVTQLELEFKKNAEALAEAGSALADADAADLTASSDSPGEPPPPPPAAKLPRARPTGRRNLAIEDLPEDRIELLDPEREGTLKPFFFEESFRLGYRRAGAVRLVVARAVYKDPETQEITTVDKPKEILERGLLAPSMIAHLLVSKYRFGIPFHRLTEMFRAEGIKLDDGLMCRYAEHVGATLGCIVLAMAKEAKETAFRPRGDSQGRARRPSPLVEEADRGASGRAPPLRTEASAALSRGRAHRQARARVARGIPRHAGAESTGWSSHRDAFTRGVFGAGSGLSAMTFARTVTSTSRAAAMSAHASSKRSL